MTKISDMFDESKVIEIGDDIMDDVKMTREEKERTASLALGKIRAERTNNRKEDKYAVKRMRPKLFGRKIAALAAVVAMIMAFGAFGYASGWFGEIELSDDKTALSTSVEDTNQYKAQVEYMDWVKEELAANGKWTKESGKREKAKLKELCEKYDLVRDGKAHGTDSADQAFSKAGIDNFLGENARFYNLDESDIGGGWEYSYWYSDGVGVNAVNPGDEIYREIRCLPRKVMNNWSFFGLANGGEKEIDVWEYSGLDGTKTRCEIYTSSSGNSTEYRFVTIAGDYTIDEMVDVGKGHKDPFNQSREEVEKYLDGFDFEKLQ